MQRIVLALAVWSVLLLTVAGLAMLALPEVGPPMPRTPKARASMEALVPESEVEIESHRRRTDPNELSSTVAPAVSTDSPSPTPTVTADPDAGLDSGAAQDPSIGSPRNRPSSAAAAARDGGGHGLGVLPPGVPAEEEGLGLHVVRADGRPAIGATVRYLLQRDLDALLAEGLDVDAMDPTELLAKSTRTIPTNSGGFAMLTSEAGTMWMDARLGDQVGWARIQRKDTGHVRIVLARDTTLTVEVVDAGGVPRADVPVVLRGASCQIIWSGRTDAAGSARLLHADGVVHKARARYQDLTIAVDVPKGDARALPRGEIPGDAVRLVANPGQRVLVWLRDAAARPCARPTRVRLAPVGMEADCDAARERTVEDGLAVFEDVPAGEGFVAVADPSCSAEVLRVEFRTTPAAESNVILAATSAMPRIRGRLVDAGGSPWRTFTVAAYVSTPAGWSAQDIALEPRPSARETSDRGEFEIDLPARHGAHAPVAFTLVARNSYGRTVCSALLELPPQDAASAARFEAHDLGAVAAKDWPILVRGTVFDENDQAIVGAWVEACEENGRPDPRTAVQCDERGQFVLRGPAPENDAVLIHATEPEQRSSDATVAVRRGEWRARVVIAVHGRLHGSILLPEGAPEGAILVRVQQPSGAELALSVDGSGEFAFSNVEAGASRISFATQGLEAEVAALEDVVIPRGGPATDPRLVGIDLREQLVVVDLEIVDERGELLQAGWVGPVTSGPARGRTYEMVDGVARILIAANGPALQISAEGYDPAILQAPRGRVRVELKPSGQ